MNHISVNPNYLRALSIIAPTKDTRYYLNGVLLEIRARETRYVATDGHRLAILRGVVSENEPDQVPATIIVPHATCKAAKLPKGLALCAMQYDAADPLAECRIDGAAALLFKPIDGKFPDYARVIPTKVSGEPGAYNWQFLADFDRLVEVAFGARTSCELYQNGTLACGLVTKTGEPFVGAVMPLRLNNPGESPDLPSWFTGRAELKVAA